MADKELISLDSFKIDTVPAVISANFSEMKALVAKTVEDRKALVTPETIQDSKSLIAEFRKTAKALSSAWKDRRTATISDVLKADDEVKALCKLLDDGAEEMAVQVKAIEDEVKEICRTMLINERNALWHEMNIKDEFCKANIDDLVKLGSLNSKRDDLSNPAKAAVKTLVEVDLAMQTRTESRLIQLENACLKNDITPLTRASVEQVLFSGDEIFNAQLNNLIAAEINRKADAEERLRKKLESEQQKAIADALAKQRAEDEAKSRNAAHEMEKQRQEEADRIAVEKFNQEQFDNTLIIAQKHESIESVKNDSFSVKYEVNVILSFEGKKGLSNGDIAELISAQLMGTQLKFLFLKFVKNV